MTGYDGPESPLMRETGSAAQADLEALTVWPRPASAGQLLGFSLTAGGIVPKLLEVPHKTDQSHWPTLALGLATLVAYIVSRRALPRRPTPLVALVGSGLGVAQA